MGTEAVDVIVECENVLLFVEVTSSRLGLASKCAGDAEAVVRDLDKTIIGKAAQLDRCIREFREGHIDFGQATPRLTQRVIPIVVTPGFTPAFGHSQEYIRGKLGEGGLLQQKGVLPLQVLSLGDLELVLNYVCSGRPLGSIMAEKAERDKGHVHQTFSQWVQANKIPDPTHKHPLIQRMFERFFGDVQETLFPGQELP